MQIHVRHVPPCWTKNLLCVHYFGRNFFFLFRMGGGGWAGRSGAEEYGLVLYRISASITRMKNCINFYHHRVVNNLSLHFGSDPTLVHYSLFCPHCRHVGVGVGGGERVYGRIGFMWAPVGPFVVGDVHLGNWSLIFLFSRTKLWPFLFRTSKSLFYLIDF